MRYSKLLCFQNTRRMPVQFKLPACLGGELFRAGTSIHPYVSQNKVRKLQVCVVYENYSCKCRKCDTFINSYVFVVTNPTLSIPKAASWFDINIPHPSDSFDDTDSFLQINSFRSWKSSGVLWHLSLVVISPEWLMLLFYIIILRKCVWRKKIN